MAENGVDAAEAPKRKKLGRPPGQPRTGGRAKGTPNKKNQITRDYIISKGAPIAFLCRVVQGKGFKSAKSPGDTTRVEIIPTLDQQLRAAEILARKVTPDLKSQELSGKDGEPIAMTLLDFLRGLPA